MLETRNCTVVNQQGKSISYFNCQSMWFILWPLIKLLSTCLKLIISSACINEIIFNHIQHYDGSDINFRLHKSSQRINKPFDVIWILNHKIMRAWFFTLQEMIDIKNIKHEEMILDCGIFSSSSDTCGIVCFIVLNIPCKKMDILRFFWLFQE